MRPYILKIENGKLLDAFVGLGANYIRLDAASAPITFKDPNGNQQVTLEAGEDVTLNEFKVLHATHDEATTQTITVYIGRDTKKSSSQVTGDIQIIGGSNNLANPPTIQEIIAPLAHETLSVQYFRSSALTSVVTHVTPAANINGIKIISAYTTGWSGANTITRIMAKASAPTITQDTGAHTIAMTVQVATYNMDSNPINGRCIIPAGLGLYSKSDDTSSVVSIEYEIL